jgi:predicted secreted protein
MHPIALRFFFSALVVSFSIGLTDAAVAGQTGTDSKNTVLHLVEAAERMVPQDRVHVDLRVEVTAKNTQEVQNAINRAMAEALDLAGNGDGVSVTSGSYSVYRSYNREGNPDGEWVGRQSLLLSGSDIQAVLDLATDLTSRGLIMSGMLFDVSPEAARSVQDELTAEALKRLRARAERIADAMGMTVDRYRSLSVGNAGGAQPPRPVMAYAAVDSAEGAVMSRVSAEPGETRISVSVDARILLRPRD